MSGNKELFQKSCGRKDKEGKTKHKQKCSVKAEANDFTNCKTTSRDKKYEVDKKTGKQTVELDSKLECDYVNPPELDKKTLLKWKRLAAIQQKYENEPQVKIAQPIFRKFMNWLDQQAEA